MHVTFASVFCTVHSNPCTLREKSSGLSGLIIQLWCEDFVFRQHCPLFWPLTVLWSPWTQRRRQGDVIIINLETKRSRLSCCSAAKCFKMTLTLRHSKSHDILRMIRDNVHSVQFLKLHLTLIKVTGGSRLNNAAFVPLSLDCRWRLTKEENGRQEKTSEGEMERE